MKLLRANIKMLLQDLSFFLTGAGNLFLPPECPKIETPEQPNTPKDHNAEKPEKILLSSPFSDDRIKPMNRIFRLLYLEIGW